MADADRAFRDTRDSTKAYLRTCEPVLFEALEALAKVIEEAKASAPGCSGGPGARCGPVAARIDRPDGPLACVYHASGHRIYPINVEGSS